MSNASPLLKTSLAGIELRNPVILAAGTCGVLDEMADVLDLSQVGALVTKSITPQPREGNATWRIIEAGPAGMLNAIGLANPGLDAFVEHIAPRVGRVPCRVIASVAGFSVDDYVQVAANLHEWNTRARETSVANADGGGSGGGTEAFAAIELNVSCPNVKTGTEFGSSPQLIRDLLSAVRPAAGSTPLIVKLSPATPELPLVAHAAALAGADALTIGNTYPAMAIDVRTRKPRLANGTGGLSGPGIHPIAVKLIRDVATKLTREAASAPPEVAAKGAVPIIGLGGVMTWEHAAEFILAGATAVGMGTALFVDPRSPLGVVRGLERWVREQGAARVGELVGAVSA